MGSDTLIDDHVSQKQTKLAAVALHKHALSKQAQRESTELLPGKEEYVWLVVAVKKVHPEKKLKPFRIPVRHPIVDPRTSPVCLITKDPQREYKDLLEAQKISFISRVVGVTKLKGKFKPFEARRLLAKENGLFLADERVVPLLPKLLGKIFFDAKKQPIPVDLTKKDLKAELESAIESTYMHQNQGTCTSIKIANLSHTPAQTLANLTTALPEVAKRIRGGWDNIQSLSIKTSSSISLPIWSCELGAGPGGRWDGLSIGAVEEEDEEWGGIDGDDPKAGDEDSEESEKTPEPVKKVEKRVEKSNEKKRRVEETEAPSTKKAKLSRSIDADIKT
ncbi:ribosomal protein L1 [Sistotremastrum suecicum HHB10207 ss-3]|uniref:Ribosomal L1 domain-containing protein 1 n=1 Tax=Sistotremastrum suecicum HHB10207 ss-3 TaxID=1314776 RepID=A0A166DUQ6_9AGAM|nr:ribosomal protein L1 [Sistotremastrum suecicum HHB10207 ss-3]